MNRLLMAAARGARVQAFSCHDSKWYGTTVFRNYPAAPKYRIHPDDAHLAYGPISTELRGAAELVRDKTYLQDILGRYGCAAVGDYLGKSDEFGCCWDTAMLADALPKSLFLLILSESLEGL